MTAAAAKRDLIAAVVAFALIIAGFFLTAKIDLSFTSDLETFSGPRAYPALILGLMLALNLVAMAQALWRLRTATAGAVSPADKAETVPHGRTKAALAELSLVLFVITFEYLGYILSMWPLLVAISFLFGARQLYRVILVSFLMMLSCLFLFRYGLNTVLPEGILGIDMIF